MNKPFLLFWEVVLLIGLISAPGVTCEYWEGRPLEMHYGETKIVNINLQNMAGGEDITVRVIIKQGNDIATLENDTYTAKFGTYDTMIPVTIIIPEDYPKTSQIIEVYTETFSENEEGIIYFGMGWTTSFNVILSRDPNNLGLDTDNDGVPDIEDNCVNNYNPDQNDSYPSHKNGVGDACECEGNFDGDLDVDGTDAALFKKDFGRSKMIRPCNSTNPCNGDFTCDGDVDGTDVSLFKQDFGRSSMNNPCPPRPAGAWCDY